MGFGQPTGPPASAKQMRELLTLLNEAGHSDFRDARGPMGFSQRQAGGKFTGEEAATFIDQLENPTETVDDAETVTVSGPDPADLAVRRMSAEKLASELMRRGWTVTAPPTTSPNAR
jgi:hypothetical protein